MGDLKFELRGQQGKYTEKLSVGFTETQREKIKKLAHENGVREAEVVRQAIDFALDYMMVKT